jgi:hypothetical protein
VHLVQVDDVHAEAPQAGFAGRRHLVRGQAIDTGAEPHLGRERHPVPVACQPRREGAFGLAVAVDVGGIDERAVGVEEPVEHPVCLVRGCHAAHVHGTDTRHRRQPNRSASLTTRRPETHAIHVITLG